MSSDPRKQGYSLASGVLEEMRRAAAHHEASLSWVAQRAWEIARAEIAKLPASPSWEARQRELAQQATLAVQQASPPAQQAPSSQASSGPLSAEPQRLAPPPKPAPSPASPERPKSPPARPPEAPLSAWEMERLGGIHSLTSEPLDSQARDLYPWDDDGPTI